MPCETLDRLDRRYRSRYGVSMVENLREIREKGIEKLLEKRKRHIGVHNVVILFQFMMANVTGAYKHE